MLKEKCALSTATCLWQEKTRITPQIPVTFIPESGSLESPTSLHLLQTALHPCVLSVLLLHSKALAGCCESPPLPLLNIWAPERLHTCSTQPGGNGFWTFGSPPIEVMGTQCFLIALGESFAQSWHKCWHTACCVLQGMVRSSCSHTTSSDSLGHMQALICEEEKLQFSSTSIHFPFSICSGGNEGMLEGDVPIQEVKAIPAPQPQHQMMASSMGHMETWDTMAMRGSCKPQPQLKASRAEVKREIIWLLKINMQLYHLCFFLVITCQSHASIGFYSVDTLLGTTVSCHALP